MNRRRAGRQGCQGQGTRRRGRHNWSFQDRGPSISRSRGPSERLPRALRMKDPHELMQKTASSELTPTHVAMQQGAWSPGLLVVASRQQRHAPVVYRFAAALLGKSDKTLREHLSEKRALRDASRIIAGCSPRRQRVLARTRQSALTEPVECSPGAASLSPETHRTNNEQIQEPILEPTTELRANAEERASLRSHVPRAPQALAHRLATTPCDDMTTETDGPTENQSDTQPRVPTGDDDIRAFFRTAFGN